MTTDTNLLYKTPSPVTAKRRLSNYPHEARAVTEKTDRVNRRLSDYAVQRVKKELLEEQVPAARRNSIDIANDLLGDVKEADSIDSTMGFRELERHIAKIKRQNFDLKLELHIRREKMTATADKLQKAEQLERENEELHEAVKELRNTLKTRDNELADCRDLIRLLSKQLESTHLKLKDLTTTPRSTPPKPRVSPIRTRDSGPLKTPVLQNDEFPAASPIGSPFSLVSLESSIRSHDEDEEEVVTDETAVEENIIPIPKEELNNPTPEIEEIRIPSKLEHSPKKARRHSMIPTAMESNRAPPPYMHERRHSRAPSIPLSESLVPATISRPHTAFKAGLVTPAPSRPITAIPPTPEYTPGLPKTSVLQRNTIRGRIFGQKAEQTKQSELPSSSSNPPKDKSIAKKNSLIRFFKQKSSTNKVKMDIPHNPDPIASSTKEVVRPKEAVSTNTPAETPRPRPLATAAAMHSQQGTTIQTNFTAPHESDKLSRYPDIRRLSVPNPPTVPQKRDWRHTQVSEMVQHWETRRDTAGEKERKRFSTTSLSGVAGASQMAVRAARDAWTAKSLGTQGGKGVLGKGKEERRERIDKLRKQRDELVRKLGIDG